VLCVNYSPALHWILSPEPNRDLKLPVPTVEELILSKEYTDSPIPHTWLRRAMVVNKESVLQVASATIGQRDNADWASLRRLRFTASNFGPLIKAAASKR
jgi:hypothetical protein